MFRMLESLCKQGQLEKALQVLLRMDRQGMAPTSNAYKSILKACIRRKALAEAKKVYAHMAKRGLESTPFLEEYMVTTLVKCGGFEDALQLFCKLRLRTVLSWTAVISGYTMFGQGHKALRMYERMKEDGVQPDAYTFVCLLKACSTIRDVEEGKRIHAEAFKSGFQSDLFVGTALVDMYGKCGSTMGAKNVFDGLSQRDVVLWTAMLAAYVEQDQADRALELYVQMQEAGVSPNNLTCLSVLQACAMAADIEEGVRLDGEFVKIKSLKRGKVVHANAQRMGYDWDVFIGSILVTMYGKCRSVADAQNVFDGLPQRDVVSWNSMLAVYAEQGDDEKVVNLYAQMQERSVSPDVRTFVILLQACGLSAGKETGARDAGYCKPNSLKLGKAIHADARRKGYDSSVFVINTLISMYGKCGSIADAENVFQLTSRDVVAWTAMLAAHVQNLQAKKALHLYEQMQDECISPDIWTSLNALQACGMLAECEESVHVDGQFVKLKTLETIKATHADAYKRFHGSQVLSGNTLIRTYGKCGSIKDAQNCFCRLFQRDVAAWTAMLAALVDHGQAEQALDIYEQMQSECVSPNDRTFVTMLQACGMLAEKERYDVVDRQYVHAKSLKTGKAFHAHALQREYDSDIFVSTALIWMYQRCGSIVDAQNVFDSLLQQDVVSWNVMLVAYLEHGQPEKALQLYARMLEEGASPDARTVMSALIACAMLADREDIVDGKLNRLQYLRLGKVIHADALNRGYDSDTFVGSTLVSIYSKCGSIKDARDVFERLPQRDVVSWNAMLTGYCDQCQGEKVLQLYEQMREEGIRLNDCTFVSALQACAMLADEEEEDRGSIRAKSLTKGRAIHVEAIMRGYSSDVFVGSTLISMYAKCGSILDARHVFHGLTEWDVVSWTTMLKAYVEQGHGGLALELYIQMQQKGLIPDDITLVCILQACSNTGSLVLLRQIHESLFAAGKHLCPLLASSLIHAYGKCSSMVDAQAVFDSVSHPDVVMWNALIAGYARQGNSLASLQTFYNMQLASMKPNSITFLSLLSACSHAGWLGRGVEYFESMTKDHGITPEVGHYVSMVDLLGRAGCFRSVEDLLSTMPMQADLPIWVCLLGACRKHAQVELAERAFNCAVRLQPTHAAAYKLMANIFADAGLVHRAKQVDELRQQVAARKQPGESWIEHAQEIHTFAVGDRKHPERKHLYDLIAEVSLELEEGKDHLSPTPLTRQVHCSIVVGVRSSCNEVLICRPGTCAR